MLRCIDDTFYVGMTNDIHRRLAEHYYGYNEQSYTYSRRPLVLMYADSFQQVIDAIAFEKRLKGWSHKKKRAFAQRDWPLLKRLAVGPRTL
jgi:putative endonuclease